jgi:ABC-type branched-subunit amino acid transport system substrate-binding protein
MIILIFNIIIYGARKNVIEFAAAYREGEIMLKRARAVLFSALVLAPLAGARGEPGVFDQEIVIGSCVDLGSPAGIRGKAMIQGAQAYFDSINEKGGVHGRKIRLISHDDLYDPEQTVKCFNQLIKENIFAGALFFGGGPAAKLVPMAESFKVPILGIIAGSKFIYEPTKHYVFNFRASYTDQAQGLIDNSWKKLNMRKFAVEAVD